MIAASDFEELVFSCKEMLIDSPMILIGEVAEAINASSSYAAMTAMALYQAADLVDIKSEAVDEILRKAHQSCSSVKVSDYKRIFDGMVAFENVRTAVTLDNDRFYISSPSEIIH